ncbi:2339_t:CDS:1 [Acaulospora colombiana]|uniref:2339_t:CDS:1 n=1 Tax=Acaulospora colombiana TaxID=27376 RepID=A0ACA9KID9_9GLOM|nr:2339_t:CDS:1 [Acaulospora colombiana]
MNYEPPKVTPVEVTIDEVKRFFVNYILSDQLGQIANAHLAKADMAPNGAFHGQCIRLAQLHSEAVDFPKTGIPAEFPLGLRAERFPDFMEKVDKPTYESQKILGKLYRSIVVDEFDPYTDISFDERLRVDGFEQYLEDARATKREYDAELRGLMNQFGVSSEYEVSSGFIVKPTVKIERKKPREVQKSVADNIAVIKRQYKKKFEREFYGDGNVIPPEKEKSMEAKAFAWYYVSYHPNEMNDDDPSERMISFPWTNWEILTKIAIKNSNKNRSFADSYSHEKPTKSFSYWRENFIMEEEKTYKSNHGTRDIHDVDDGMNYLRESLRNSHTRS